MRPTTTASHVRNLREAGLLTKTGRGITGAHMSSRDAAHLIIAATCSQDVKDSVETVRRYGKTPHIGNAVQAETFPALATLGDRHTFADALAALLSGDAIGFLAADPKSTVVVTFDYPTPEVLLEVSTHGSGFERAYKTPWPRKAKTVIRGGDLRVRYTFTEQTIFTVGNLLRGED
jgi:hypothetical protein